MNEKRTDEHKCFHQRLYKNAWLDKFTQMTTPTAELQ